MLSYKEFSTYCDKYCVEYDLCVIKSMCKSIVRYNPPMTFNCPCQNCIVLAKCNYNKMITYRRQCKTRESYYIVIKANYEWFVTGY